MIRSFVDMDVWKKANKLSVNIFQLTAMLPRSEDYALTAQIRRSSNSVSGNIAEGYGRTALKEKRYFYSVARGSSFETQSHVLYGSGVGYFCDQQARDIIVEYDDLIHQLNKIMKSIG